MENDHPELSQLTYLIQNLRYNGWIDDDVNETNIEHITTRQYKYILALMYNNEGDKLAKLLDDLLIKNK